MAGYKTWAALEEVTATNMNSYVRDQTVNIYTNDAARTAAGGGTPSRGGQAFLTDSMEHQVYYGATTGWRRPWSIAWGYIGASTNLTSTGPGSASTTYVDSGLTYTTPSLLLNRVVRWTVTIGFYSSLATGAADRVRVALRDGSSTVQGAPQLLSLNPAALVGSNFTLSWRETVAATGTVTRKLSYYREAGAGATINGYGDATFIASMYVEDIGPASTTPPAA